MKSFAVMPSNIALIKYMGKGTGNLPLNPSLSYTTSKFESYVEIEKSDSDHWEPLVPNQIENLYAQKVLRNIELIPEPIKLNVQETEKFLKYFKALKELYKIKDNFVVRSYNAFPASCGLASSASSFAALTMAAHRAFTGEEHPSDIQKLSRLSQKGSGSSCRSFFSPWAICDEQGARPSDIKLELDHYVIVVESEKKKISSSEAHLRVLTSENFVGRPERAKKRLAELIAIIENDWPKAFELCWNEFWDMHSLFKTSRPPFGYMRPASATALDILLKFWDEAGNGPLVTMDAGANIHLLFRKTDEAEQEECLKRLSGFKVL